MVCDFVCILSVIAIEFFSRTSSKELPTKAAIALNHTIYALRFFLRMHCSGKLRFVTERKKKKKEKTKPNLYLGSYLLKARVIRDKLLTLIYFVIARCPTVGTTWYSASCARSCASYEGFKTAPESEWLCIVCRPLDSKRLRNC